jgi:hypothetical protein
MRRASSVLIPLALAALVTACGSVASPSPTSRVTPGPDGGESPATTDQPVQPTPASSGTEAEPNVIAGRVMTEAGQPIPGARLRIVGYTGGANLGQEIETVESGSDGAYRYEVPRGLYEVLGQATVDFDGQAYTFDLDPADGSCEQQMSDSGIVKDFMLRLTGLKMCRIDDLADNYTSYHGAAIQLFNGFTSSPASDAVIEYTLEPTGPLADGSTGETLTMERTVAALDTSAGPIEDTWILHDIPLATYRASAVLVEGGARTPLLVSGDTGSMAADVEIRFNAREFLGGYTVPQLSVHDPAGAG